MPRRREARTWSVVYSAGLGAEGSTSAEKFIIDANVIVKAITVQAGTPTQGPVEVAIVFVKGQSIGRGGAKLTLKQGTVRGHSSQYTRGLHWEGNLSFVNLPLIEALDSNIQLTTQNDTGGVLTLDFTILYEVLI